MPRPDQPGAPNPEGRPAPTSAGQPFGGGPQFYIRISPPTATRALLIANVAVFLAMIVAGYLWYGTLRGTEDLNVLVRFGAKVNELVAAGQWWRLFTAMFLHIGVLHILFNLYALNALGPLVEGYFGHARFLAIYLIGGLYGSLASYAFSPAISAGASGAIFGLAGALIVYFLRYRANFGARGRALLQNMFIIIGINLVFGLSARGIDNWGHIGGLIGGAAVTYGLLPRYLPPSVFQPGTRQALQEEVRTTSYIMWVTACVLVLVLGVALTTRYLQAAG